MCSAGRSSQTKLDHDALSSLRRVLAAAPAVDDPVAVSVSRDPKDDYLIALARQAGADCIVSGDADLSVLDDLVPPVRTPAAADRRRTGDRSDGNPEPPVEGRRRGASRQSR